MELDDAATDEVRETEEAEVMERNEKSEAPGKYFGIDENKKTKIVKLKESDLRKVISRVIKEQKDFGFGLLGIIGKVKKAVKNMMDGNYQLTLAELSTLGWLITLGPTALAALGVSSTTLKAWKALVKQKQDYKSKKGMRTIKEQAPLYTCVECGAEFELPEDLADHYEEHLSGGPQIDIQIGDDTPTGTGGTSGGGGGTSGGGTEAPVGRTP